MKTVDKFDLETLYQHYLKVMKLKEKEMSPVQRTETKKAFVAGLGQMLILALTELPKFSGKKQQELLAKLRDQTNRFWLIQTGFTFIANDIKTKDQ